MVARAQLASVPITAPPDGLNTRPPCTAALAAPAAASPSVARVTQAAAVAASVSVMRLRIVDPSSSSAGAGSDRAWSGAKAEAGPGLAPVAVPRGVEPTPFESRQHLTTSSDSVTQSKRTRVYLRFNVRPNRQISP